MSDQPDPLATVRAALDLAAKAPDAVAALHNAAPAIADLCREVDAGRASIATAESRIASIGAEIDRTLGEHAGGRISALEAARDRIATLEAELAQVRSKLKEAAIAAPRVAPSPTPGICAAIEQAAAWIELGEIGATPDGEALVATLRGFTRAPRVATVARPIAEWHEDHGPALWWQFPVDEPPYSGSPLDDDWPGYHTHWTPIVCPVDPASRGPIGER